jgi:GT2 family glycosyltransferase
MIDLTIVIVNYETCGLLSHCLDSIAKACLEHPKLRVESIVVDNGSRDGSIDAALASPVLPRIVALVGNRGFAAAVNYALRIRRGRHVLLLNSDVEIETNVLAGGVALLDESTDVGVLGIALVHPDGRRQRSVHALPSLMTELVPEAILRMTRPRKFSNAVRSGLSGPEKSICEVEAVRGAAFFIQGELLEKVGLLDEGYFFFLEETDYCWRVRAAGYRVLYCSTLRAMHRLGASSKRRAPLATRIEFHRSLYRFLDRRHGYAVGIIARGSRVIRTAVSCMGLFLLGAGSASARSRLAERWGLLLWHLRGCPLQPDLGQTLRVVVESGRGRVHDPAARAEIAMIRTRTSTTGSVDDREGA